MGTELSPLTAVQDKIRDKIRAEFVALIPDEMWDGMVQSVISDFTRDRSVYDRKIEAPIKAMIREAIEAECKAKFAAELDRHRASFNGFGEMVVSEATEAMIRDHMPRMLAAMQEGATRMMVDLAIQNMRNSMGQY